jgi:hypothetical protein
MEGLKDLSSLQGMQGAIDVAQIHIQKLKSNVFVTSYYSFISKAYSMQLQTIIDHRKQFLDVFMGMLGSMNDARVIHLSLIYLKLITSMECHFLAIFRNEHNLVEALPQIHNYEDV